MQHGLDIIISKPTLQIQEVFWVPPPVEWLKANTDGSKSDDRAGYGFILRDQFGHLVQAVAACVEAKTINFLELQAIGQSVKAAMELGVNHLRVESDSNVAIHWVTRSDKVPWRARRLCNSIRTNCRTFIEVKLTHIHREGNALADMTHVWPELQALMDWDISGSPFIREKLR
ncbi:hypothetical protein QJS10_CPB12g01015 [Acorus calamus]|uniref:RNase H type-1 domain-containing protein n=1 Tax=Acorus calamus TaxID=4465 RepID=A0AAV9DPN5_ACOCL|nr:hypothetical protein QJS10_CPB12g01015 [Acorus calamus]